ncbi:MAG TPA: HAD family hydrolase [Ignavibacteriaceae bacterium]
MEDSQKILLILDLDETLVYSKKSRLSFNEDFIVGDYFVYKRPGLDEFLESIKKHFDVAIWTSSTEDYAQEVVNNIFPEKYPLKFIFGRTKCTLTFLFEENEYIYAKNLSKLKRKNYSLERILIVDDSPEKLRRNYGNHIRVEPFTGLKDDNELSILIKFLEMIKAKQNVRKIEKRAWRLEVK